MALTTDGRSLFGAYQTLGELTIATGIDEATVTGYRRQLDPTVPTGFPRHSH